MATRTVAVADLARYPLLSAIFGRRSRRFGLGMKIPSGPLAFASRSEPYPLSELEQDILVAAGTGVTGWNYGVPFSPVRPDEHGHYTERYTGRTAPTAAGIGTPVLFYTDDSGIYVTNTHDVRPSGIREASDGAEAIDRILDTCRAQTTKLSDSRLDLPSAPLHMLGPNLWMANAPGSTLFMPVGDASEELLGILAIMIGHGAVVMDDRAKRPAGNLAPFIRSGLLKEGNVVPLSTVELITYEGNTAELAFVGHNIVLAMQALGLGGGLYIAGLNPLSVLGAMSEEGVRGLGFRFVCDERWTVPYAVGLDGIYEALCPPYYPDMRAAVRAFVARKFGPGGAYDPETPGPWKDSVAVRRSVPPYSDEFVDCMGEVAQYVYDTYGRFPGSVPTIALTGYVQAQHIDTEYYDTHFEPGAYLDTHAEHMGRWHGEREA